MKIKIHTNGLLFLRLCRIICITASVVFSSSAVYAQITREYAVEDLPALEADLAAAACDIYILSSSGGMYDLSAYITLSQSLTLRAKEGLEEKPTIKRSNNTGVNGGIFRTQAGTTIDLVLEGIIFDGLAPIQGLSAFRAEGIVHFHIKHCGFINFQAAAGVFRLEGEGTSFNMQYSYMAYNSRRLIHLYVTDKEYGPIYIENSTFHNNYGAIVYYRRAGGLNTRGTSLTMNHVTFYKNATDEAFLQFREMSGEASIKNCIFVQSEGEVLNGTASFDHCYLDGLSPSPAGNFSLTTIPQFEDAPQLNFKLVNANDMIAGTGDVAGNTMYYPPRVVKDLEVIDDTHVKLTFSRPVNQESAEQTENYTLGGSAGMLGHPQSAILENSREVVLQLGDLSELSNGESITIAVTGVSDLNGLLIDENNLASFTLMQFSVYALTQILNNTTNQFAIAQSSMPAGFIYIVKEGEPQNTKEQLDAAVLRAMGAFAAVNAANTDILIAVSDLIPGIYYAYAVSPEGNLSGRGPNAITITDGFPPEVSNSRQTVTNGTHEFVLVQSSKDSGRVYIILSGVTANIISELDAAVINKEGGVSDVTVADTGIPVSTRQLIPGIYYAYATDDAGNISARGSEPMHIIMATSASRQDKDHWKTYVSGHLLIVEGFPDLSQKIEISLVDLSGRLVHHANISNERAEILLPTAGIYIVNVMYEGKRIFSNKFIYAL
jgi:hypothetical protein